MKLLILTLSLFCIQNTFANTQDSSIICEGKTINGNKDGVWKCFQNNKVVKKETYKNGVLKTYSVYNQKGEVIETRDKKGRIRNYKPCGCQ